MMINRAGIIAFTLCAATLLWSPVHAQAFPTKQIQLVVPFPPGGGTDVFARLVSQSMGESLGQQVVVINRAGAQGSIGLALVAKAPADGYTIGLAEMGSITLNPWMFQNAGFDPVKDFSSIGVGVVYPSVVVVGPTVPAKDLKELVALGKTRQLSFASGSASSQLAGELFKMVATVDMLHVPYKGAATAALDLVGGQVDLTCVTAGSAVSLVRAGKIRAIAVMGPKRLAALPEVPTSRESGFPDFEQVGWFGLVAPAGTPREVVARLNAALNKALAQSDIREKLEVAGLESKPGTPEEMTALVESEYVRWGKVVKSVGIRPE